MRDEKVKSNPSASSMDRIIGCPASWGMNKQETIEIQNEYSIQGTKLHSILEDIVKTGEFTAAYGKLDTDEKYIVDYCIEGLSELIDINFYDMEDIDILTEVRLWSEDESHSGQADVIIKSNNRAIVVDYKTGRGEVDPACLNYQMATLATLVRRKYGVSEVLVAILQPKAISAPRKTLATYDDKGLDKLEKGIYNAIKAALSARKNKKMCTGKYCKYCPSAYRCPLLVEKSKDIVQSANAGSDLVIDKTNAKAYFENAKLVQKYCEAILNQVEAFAAKHGLEDTGLEYKAGSKVKEGLDWAGIYEDMNDNFPMNGITYKEFIEKCCIISIPKVFNFIKENMGEEKYQKSMENSFVDDLLRHEYIKIKENKPTLKIKK